MHVRWLVRLMVLVAGFGSLGASAAHAGTAYDPTGFRFSSDTYTTDENSGLAVITVQRSDVSQEAHAAYIAVGMGHPCGASQCTATSPFDANHVPGDFRATQGTLDFPAGVAQETFSVPIVDHHFTTIAKTVSVGIYASWPQGTAHPDHAVLTILGDEPTTPRDPANPLELAATPPAGNPLAGASFFADPQDPPSRFEGRFPALHAIAIQPNVERFGTFSGADVGIAVNRYLVHAGAVSPGTIPLLATYKLVDLHCGHWTPTAGDQADYRYFVDRLAQGIGSDRAVMLLEMDSVITMGCLTGEGVNIRVEELRNAIATLTADCPHLVVYLDAGAADAASAPRVAAMLNRIGLSSIQGFFLNSTHFDWTSREINYGERISGLTSGKHFIINTGFNGQGPLATPDPARDGNEVLCNPAGRGLGPKPTTQTGFVRIDAFEWTTNPGESFGQCVPGAPPLGHYWPQYGVMLVHNANFFVDSTYPVSTWASGASATRVERPHKRVRPRRHPRPRHGARRRTRPRTAHKAPGRRA